MGEFLKYDVETSGSEEDEFMRMRVRLDTCTAEKEEEIE